MKWCCSSLEVSSTGRTLSSPRPYPLILARIQVSTETQKPWQQSLLSSMAQDLWVSRFEGTASIKMCEIAPSHVKETSFTCSLVINWIQTAACSFRMFERPYFMLTKVCRARINYLKLLSFLRYLLTVWSHIFTQCSQGGKVTLGNTLCTFK